MSFGWNGWHCRKSAPPERPANLPEFVKTLYPFRSAASSRSALGTGATNRTVGSDGGAEKPNHEDKVSPNACKNSIRKPDLAQFGDRWFPRRPAQPRPTIGSHGPYRWYDAQTAGHWAIYRPPSGTQSDHPEPVSQTYPELAPRRYIGVSKFLDSNLYVKEVKWH